MEVVSSNLANSHTTRTAEGGPYRRKQPVFDAQMIETFPTNALGRGVRAVRVVDVVDDPSDFVMRHEPGHPDADERGLVAYPNVDPIREMIDMMSATRSYEANVTLVRSVREMLQGALQILA